MTWNSGVLSIVIVIALQSPIAAHNVSIKSQEVPSNQQRVMSTTSSISSSQKVDNTVTPNSQNPPTARVVFELAASDTKKPQEDHLWAILQQLPPLLFSWQMLFLLLLAYLFLHK